jgi:hypothetical protein
MDPVVGWHEGPYCETSGGAPIHRPCLGLHGGNLDQHNTITRALEGVGHHGV